MIAFPSTHNDTIQMFSLIRDKVIEILYSYGTNIISVVFITHTIDKYVPNLTGYSVTVYGYFIAGDLKLIDNSMLHLESMISYRLIEVKDYPLLLGYAVTSDRLSQLLKGEG